jgi:hypothetical protein
MFCRLLHNEQMALFGKLANDLFALEYHLINYL